LSNKLKRGHKVLHGSYPYGVRKSWVNQEDFNGGRILRYVSEKVPERLEFVVARQVQRELKHGTK